MKLKLPHKTFELDMEASIEKRMTIINEILNDVIEFQEASMTVEEYFRETWNKSNTKVCMDIIGYYLTKVEKDLTILSNDRNKEMLKGSKRHTTFSGMGYENQVSIGLVDIDDSNYN